MLVERGLRSMAGAATHLPTTNSTAGHLCVRVDDAHAVDVPFLFEQQRQRMGRAVIASFGSHVAIFLVVLFAIRYAPKSVATAALLPFQADTNIIWLSQPGPGGGGGGGG